MGFEFKLFVELNPQEKETVNEILNRTTDPFPRPYSNRFIMEEDGIYICTYDRPDPWQKLTELKQFLDDKKRNYVMEEL